MDTISAKDVRFFKRWEKQRKCKWLFCLKYAFLLGFFAALTSFLFDYNYKIKDIALFNFLFKISGFSLLEWFLGVRLFKKKEIKYSKLKGI